MVRELWERQKGRNEGGAEQAGVGGLLVTRATVTTGPGPLPWTMPGSVALQQPGCKSTSVKRCWRSRRDGGVKRFLLCFSLILKIFLLWGHCRGEQRILGDWEVSRIRVHDVKF